MRVYIAGPNLRDQSKGSFHVHQYGCGDIARNYNIEPEYREGWPVEASTKKEVVVEVYGDQMSENPDAEAEYDSYRNDLYFFPCCSELPE